MDWESFALYRGACLKASIALAAEGDKSSKSQAQSFTRTSPRWSISQPIITCRVRSSAFSINSFPLLLSVNEILHRSVLNEPLQGPLTN